MHNAALAELTKSDERFSTWTYYKFDIEPEDLQEALNKFFDCGFIGLNLTVPHKVLAAQWIPAGESEVELTGACNTLLRTPNGFVGYNTDLYGLTRAIESDLNIVLRDRDVLLLGAGGAARAAAVACAQSGVRRLILANRTSSKIETILASLSKLKTRPEIQTCQLADVHSIKSENLLVINATSLGLDPRDPSPIDFSQLPPKGGALDMIYNPPKTAFLREAESRGLTTANGLGMLVYQGERSLRIWTQENPSAKTMLHAAQTELITS